MGGGWGFKRISLNVNGGDFADGNYGEFFADTAGRSVAAWDFPAERNGSHSSAQEGKIRGPGKEKSNPRKKFSISDGKALRVLFIS